MKRPRLWAALACAGWLAAAIYGTADAHANPTNCRTDYMSSTTYIYCHGTDYYGNPVDTVTICYDNQNYCTTKDE